MWTSSASEHAPARSRRGANGSDAGTAVSGSVVVVVLIRARSALWSLARLVRGPGAFAGTPGLRFAKVLGSGRGGGFGLVPSATHGGLLCEFDDLDSAARFVDGSPVLARWRREAAEYATLLLRPLRTRGSWGGHAIRAAGSATAGAGPVAALTRGSVRPSRALEFWRHAAPSQAAVEHAPGCLLAAGLGEAPLLRQATLSVWASTEAMDGYARQGAHQQAIRAAAAGGHFSESMFVRFEPLAMHGQWRGRSLG